jgi:hypothetical protein
MKSLIRRPPVALLLFALGVLGLWPGSRADERDRLAVGLQSDGRVVVPTNQVLKPAGRQIHFPGRPVDLALTDDGQTLVVKNIKDLVFIDTAAGKVKQTLASPVGFSVVGLLALGERIHVTDVKDHVRVAVRQAGGKYAWGDPIALNAPKVKGSAHPAGLAPHPKARDFRLLSIGKAYKKSALKGDGEGVYVARVDRPAAGWTAFFAELVFDSGDPRAPYKFTTQVHIVPDVLPHSFEDFRKTIK